MKVNEKGQITIPSKLREQFGLLPGTAVSIEVNKDGILLKPAESHRVQVAKWLEDEHGSAMASLTTQDIMHLIKED
jgi:AbrB family looped-hinge helix DNA binding protein